MIKSIKKFNDKIPAVVLPQKTHSYTLTPLLSSCPCWLIVIATGLFLVQAAPLKAMDTDQNHSKPVVKSVATSTRFYKDSEHPLTRTFWGEQDLSSRLDSLTSHINEIRDKIINYKIGLIEEIKQNIDMYQEIFKVLPSQAEPIQEMHYIQFEDLLFNSDTQQNENKGYSGAKVKILSQGDTKVAIKKFKNLEEGLKELFESLIALDINPAPSELKMARIYDAVICPDHSLSIIMEGAHTHDIHHFLSKGLADNVLKACAKYLATFHVKNHRKLNESLNFQKFISHAAYFSNTLVQDPLKDQKSLPLFSLFAGQQWADLEDVRSNNIIQLLHADEQKEFIRLKRRSSHQFKENASEIYRLLRSANTEKQGSYFLTKNHGDAHGRNFFYDDDPLPHSVGVAPDSLLRITMIDFASIVDTYGDIGDPAEDIGRFLGSLWDWAAQTNANEEKIYYLQNQFIQTYLQEIKNNNIFTRENMPFFEKKFKENYNFYKLRYYRAIFNSDKDRKSDETKLKLLRSWIKENTQVEKEIPEHQHVLYADTLKEKSYNRSWKSIKGAHIHWLPDSIEGFIESTEKESNKSYLTLLWEELHRTGSATLSSKATIAGMGGVGKSSLALEYAHEARKNKAYNLIHWISSGTEYSLLKGYKDLLRNMGISIKDGDDEEIVNLVNKHLSEKSKCLLIYDNVPNPTDFQKFQDKLPRNTHVLITSRCHEGWGKSPLNLDVFRAEDSINYLFNITGLKRLPENENIVRELAEALGHLPLALSHAAYYIKLVGGVNVSRQTFEQYLEDFRKAPTIHFEEYRNLLTDEKSEITYQNLIGKTLSLSKVLLSKTAEKLIVYSAYLDADSIGEDIFLEYYKNNKELEEALKQLSTLSLIKRITDKPAFSIHRLLQLVIRGEKEAQSMHYQNLFCPLVDIFNRLFEENINTDENIKKLLNNLSHFFQLLEHSKRQKLTAEEIKRFEWLGKVLFLLKQDTMSEESFIAFHKNQLLSFHEYNDLRLQKLLKKMQDLFESSARDVDLPDWLIEIAEKSHSQVQTILGSMYENSLFIIQNYKKAILWYTKAVHQKNPAAEFRLENVYKKMSRDETVKRLIEVAEEGDANAQAKLAMHYRTSEGVPEDEKKAVELYIMAAKKGHFDAQFHLATMYHWGSGVSQSDIETVKWLTEAAEQGHSEAQVSLGIIYATGRGVDKDDTEAIKWFTIADQLGNGEARVNLDKRYPNNEWVDKAEGKVFEWFLKAAHKGLAAAQYNLGVRYETGQGVPKNEKKAIELYTIAAQQGHSDAQVSLGIRYAEGQGVVKDDVEAVNWFTKAAEQGNTNAQANLGVIYATNDRKINKDEKKALEYYTMAAEQGHGGAQVLLAEVYANGLGADKDEAQAIRWYTMAAKQGEEKAIKYLIEVAERGCMDVQYDLGYMYTYGLGVGKDIIEAIRWYTMAAMQGHLDAQIMLGEIYTEGRGVPKNEEKAVEWFIMAAKQGDEHAQIKLGEMYTEGRGVPKNEEKAVEWFSMAAKQGKSYAQVNLGIRYSTGQGVGIDDAQAIKWLVRAAKQGNEEALANLEKRYPNSQWVNKDDTWTSNWYSIDDEELGIAANTRYDLALALWCSPDPAIKDEKGAVEWYSRAELQGDKEAQFSLGSFFLKGKGADMDETKAFNWFTKAAEQGDKRAQFNLGLMYIKGQGINKDDKKAFKWFSEAAKRGHATAQYNLGLMCMNGQGVDKDDKEAFKWFLLAAPQHRGAEFHLAMMLKHYSSREVQGQLLTLFKKIPQLALPHIPNADPSTVFSRAPMPTSPSASTPPTTTAIQPSTFHHTSYSTLTTPIQSPSQPSVTLDVPPSFSASTSAIHQTLLQDNAQIDMWTLQANSYDALAIQHAEKGNQKLAEHFLEQANKMYKLIEDANLAKELYKEEISKNTFKEKS